jgi:hypothetical protein
MKYPRGTQVVATEDLREVTPYGRIVVRRGTIGRFVEAYDTEGMSARIYWGEGELPPNPSGCLHWGYDSWEIVDI